MDELESKIEGGRKTVYHEIGHIIGYILSDELEQDGLGQIEEFNIGFNLMIVISVSPRFHYNSIMEEREQIFKDTSNVLQTTAWFFEVLSGCCLQTLYDKNGALRCLETNGKIDEGNMLAIRNLSAFTWTWDDIKMLIVEIENLFKEFDLVNIFKKKTTSILFQIQNSDEKQLKFEGHELKELVTEINSLLPKDLKVKYNEIVRRYAGNFSKKINVNPFEK